LTQASCRLENQSVRKRKVKPIGVDLSKLARDDSKGLLVLRREYESERVAVEKCRCDHGVSDTLKKRQYGACLRECVREAPCSVRVREARMC